MMLDALVVASTCAGLVLGHRVLRAYAGARDRCDPDSAVWRRPSTWFVMVVAALYVNQVLCTVYILRMYGGDPSFIADHLPGGWFDLADDNRALRAIAAFWPAPEVLSVAVLRVPALLELPFAVLAYLTVLRWADRDLYRRLVGSQLIWVASAAYSVTFCLVELALPNPYTTSDLVLRVVSALVTPLVVRQMSCGEDARMRDHDAGVSPASVVGVAAFAVSLGAFGVLVLVVYDTALLYNLAHLPLWWRNAAVAFAVLVVARLVTTWLTRPAAGHTAATLIAGIRRFLVLFFAPALSIRYTLGFGSAAVGLTAALAIGGAALGGAIRETASSADSTARLATTMRALATRVTVCVVVGGAAGAVALNWNGRYPEQTLLVAAAALAAGALSTAVLLDELTPVRSINRSGSP